VTLVREAVSYTYHATSRRLPNTNIAYLHIPTFGAPIIARETRDALTALAAQGPLDGLIIDLRLNGGGASDVLNDIQKLFLDGGSAGWEVTRTGRRPITVPAGQTLPALRGKPIVLLVSGLCESACEYFTVALHDRGRATVLGTHTAGNTESLDAHDFADGSRLLLAEMLLQRPDGGSIEDTGFPPDVVLDVPWYRATSLEADPQVQAALRLLQER
jgi:carboxyl-terminal processing protease